MSPHNLFSLLVERLLLNASELSMLTYNVLFEVIIKLHLGTGQFGLGVGSWPSNRATEGSNTKGTRLYFVILLKNVEKIFDWHLYNRLKDALMCR